MQTAEQSNPKAVFLAVQADNVAINPSKEIAFEKIYFTESKSAWITIEWLSEELMLFAKRNYQDLFRLHPVERGKVVMHDKETTSFRWHQSYLNTPHLDEVVFSHKSYMYSGKNNDNNMPLPPQFEVFLDFLNVENCASTEDKYNQVTANWYANGKDYIAAHSDCQINMKPQAGIAVLSFNEDENNARKMIFTPRKLQKTENDSICSHVEVLLPHGCIITMFGDMQEKFRHRVPQNQDVLTSRISLTFRKF